MKYVLSIELVVYVDRLYYVIQLNMYFFTFYFYLTISNMTYFSPHVTL